MGGRADARGTLRTHARAIDEACSCATAAFIEGAGRRSDRLGPTVRRLRNDGYLPKLASPAHSASADLGWLTFSNRFPQLSTELWAVLVSVHLDRVLGCSIDEFTLAVC